MRTIAKGILAVAIVTLAMVPATPAAAATATLQRLSPGFSTYPASPFENSATGDVTGPATLVDVQIPPGPVPDSSTSGCQAADFAGFAAGQIAVLQRGGCTFAVKAANAQAAGAVAVVIFNEGQPGRTGVVEGSLPPALVGIPVVGTSFDVGQELLTLPPGVVLRVAVTASAGSATCASPPAPGTPLGGKNVLVAQQGVVTVGTEGPDVIYGTTGPDRIAGLGGDDVIFGFGGADQLSGGDGADAAAAAATPTR